MQASWHWAPQFSLLWKRNQRERRWTVELWPGTGLNVAQGRSRNRWHSWQACFCWYWWPPLARYAAAASVLPGWLGRKWVSAYCGQCHANREKKGKNEIGHENKMRCLRLKWVDRHMAGVSCSVLSSGHVMGPQLHYVTAMNGDRLAPPDAGFGWEEKLISYLSSLIYGCHEQDT